VEDTTAVGPVAVEVAGFEESVSFPKKNWLMLFLTTLWKVKIKV
jgi:steroid 5-alpha reductase family enzyme